MNILKNILIAGVLLLCGFSYGHAQEGQPFDRAKNLAWLEHYLGVDTDPIKTELYNLCKAGNFAAAALRAKMLQQTDPANRTYPAFLASCYYSMGYTDKARGVAMDFLRYRQKEQTLLLEDVLLLGDVPTFYSLYRDTVLQKRMQAFYTDCCQEPALLLPAQCKSLRTLYYNDQAMRKMFSFQRAFSASEAEQEYFRSQFIVRDSMNRQQFVHLYDDHSELFEEKV